MNQKTINVVFLGNTGVGKTSIVYYYLNGFFCKDTLNTIGLEHSNKTININDQYVKLNLWDTAGQERYKSVAPTISKQANVCIFVADASDIESFKGVDGWRKILDKYGKNPQMILAINKIDLDRDLENDINDDKSDINSNDQLPAERNKFLNEVRNLLTDYPYHLYVSALNGTGINDLFDLAARLGLENQSEPSTDDPDGINEKVDSPKKSCT